MKIKSLLLSLTLLLSVVILTSMDSPDKVILKKQTVKEVTLTPEQQVATEYIKNYLIVKNGSLFNYTQQMLQQAPPSSPCEPGSYALGCLAPHHWYYATDNKWYECRYCAYDAGPSIVLKECCYPYNFTTS